MSNYSNIERKVQQIVKKTSLYMVNFDKKYISNEIFKAYEFARDAHEGQMRLSGGPYIEHPVEATLILLNLKPDIHTIQACILHDVLEDTEISEKEIKDKFGTDVAFLCTGMEKVSKVRYTGINRNISSLRKMFVAMAEDLRVIFIKLSDRLHNMKTLSHHPKPEKRERIAMETLNIYSPIADRLGLHSLKDGLNEECFKILEPESYKKLKKELKEIKKNCDLFVKNAETEIESLIGESIKGYKIDYRIKSVYSIHKKMLNKGLDNATDLYDLFGIRIIVNNISDCYKTLGLIHNKWKPIPNRFKDYIALPKTNGYKSLHTTIIGLLKSSRSQPTEIQIKTKEMKEFSDIGVAAHFDYKEKGSKISKDIDWVKELKDLTESVDNNDLLNSFKIDVFKDRIFVFTPKGDSINLPKGSTPVDFAYYVHTDLGNHISLAKVDGAVCPLDKELSNGNVLEIIINKKNKPNPFWLSFVKTLKAKNRIKNYLKSKDKGLYLDRGIQLLNEYLEKASLDKLDKDFSILKVLEGRENNIQERSNILEKIGDYSITPNNVIKEIFKTKNIRYENKVRPEENKETDKKKSKKIEIIIGGEEDIAYKLDYCCRRKIPKNIVAHINKKGIINIHSRDCKVLKGVNIDRLMSAYIKGEKKESLRIKLNMLFRNKSGIVKTLTTNMFNMEIGIDEIYSKKQNFDETWVNFILDIPDYDYLILDRFIYRIKNIFDKDLVKYKIENIKE